MTGVRAAPLAIVIVLSLVCLVLSGCGSPVAKVKGALAAGDLDKALAAAAAAPEELRPELAEALREWAGVQDLSQPGQWLRVVQAYRAAIGLAPGRADLYLALADVAVRARTQGWPGADSSPVWAELLEMWQEAGAADPKLAAAGPFQAAGAKFALAVDPDSGAGGEEKPADFTACVQAAVRALREDRRDIASTYAGQAAALDPSHPAVLALWAELGLLAPVPAARTASLPLWAPASIPCAPCGEWVLLCGRIPGGGSRACFGLRASDLSLAWQIEDPRDCSLSLSPTGRYLAYTRTVPQGQSCDVYVYDTATGQTQVAFSTKGPVDATAWAPDEGLLAACSYEGLVVGSRDGTMRLLVEPAEYSLYGGTTRKASSPAWFSGGDGLAVQDQHMDSVGALWVYDPVTFIKRRVELAISGRHYPTYAFWSPDGSRVAVETRLCEEAGFGVGVAATRADKPNELSTVVRAPDEVAASVQAWSPDGRYLMFTMSLVHQPRTPGASELASYLGSRLWLWDGLTGELLFLPTTPRVRAAWSPDGKAIYFVDPVENALVKLELQLELGCCP